MQGKTNFVVLAKVLRTEQTPWETKLWMHLRGGRLNNLKFKRQVPIGSYIVDFCCDELKLAVELDGGHHDETRVRAKDTEKREFLRKEGYRILRFWNNEIDQNIQGVLKKILQIATSLPASPHAWGEGAEWKCSHRGEGNKI